MIKKLEAIRGFAAFYVMLGHWVLMTNDSLSNKYKIFFKFGQEAVILFFLLSGFVIYLSFNKAKDKSFKTYFIKRFRRIYFPVIVALGITVICELIRVKNLDGFSWSELIGNLLMLQDFSYGKPGSWFNSFLGNGPLWSLSYEWWFYMMFFPVILLSERINTNDFKIVIVTSLVNWGLYLIYPNHLSLVIFYLVIWWIGIMAAKGYVADKDFTWKTMKPLLITSFTFTLFAAVPFLYYDFKFSDIGLFPVLIFRHFLSVSIILSVGVIWWRYKMKFFDQIFGIFVYLAPISYALYLFHFPIIRLNLSDNLFFDILLKLSLIIGLSYLTEIILQPKVNKLIKIKKKNVTN